MKEWEFTGTHQPLKIIEKLDSEAPKKDHNTPEVIGTLKVIDTPEVVS